MKYERIKYPDGQISAKITALGPPYAIKERINSYEDLLFVRSIAEIANFQGIQLELHIPCMFGQRSDRRFTTLQSFDLQMIAEIINACKFSQVFITDPHSDVTLALINNSVKVDPAPMVHRAIMKINSPNLILVSPDAGAYKKVFHLGAEFNLPVVAAVKHRDLSGAIELSFIGDVKGKDCLIVDDLCSRGNTFLQLNEKLRTQEASKVYLYVTHFEGGGAEYKQTIDNLKAKIDGIYTTNSFREFDSEDESKIKIFKII
jgi:ribose-phosphate pyrophosphokinase